jgi:hypothetical protein
MSTCQARGGVWTVQSQQLLSREEPGKRTIVFAENSRRGQEEERGTKEDKKV